MIGPAGFQQAPRAKPTQQDLVIEASHLLWRKGFAVEMCGFGLHRINYGPELTINQFLAEAERLLNS